MKLDKFFVNYATLKKRGYGDNVDYIYTVHKYPVRMPGYEDINFLKTLNSSASLDLLSPSDIEGEVRFQSSIARSRSRVMQLGCNNRWDYFVTLTVSPESSVDRYDLKAVVKSLLKFFDNYKQRRSTGFKYLVIPEKHKDGAYHFHGFFANINVADLKTNQYGYLDFVPYCKKYGFCSMDPIRDAVACANYVSKYITKDMFAGTIPEPRTHLYYASRGLKFDEVVAVGSAVPVKFDDSADFRSYDSGYCVRYFCKQNIFSAAIVPFENVAVAPELPTADCIDYLKKIVTFKFCNRNNIPVNDKTDLLKLYKSVKHEIISDSLTEYDVLRQFYSELRKGYSCTQLTDEEAARLDELFHVSVVDEVINVDSYTDVEYSQLDLWGDDDADVRLPL